MKSFLTIAIFVNAFLGTLTAHIMTVQYLKEALLPCQKPALHHIAPALQHTSQYAPQMGSHCLTCFI